jgi:hypothetical protein
MFMSGLNLAPRILKFSLSPLVFGGLGDTEIWCVYKMKLSLFIVSSSIFKVWLSPLLLVSHPAQLSPRKRFMLNGTILTTPVSSLTLTEVAPGHLLEPALEELLEITQATTCQVSRVSSRDPQTYYVLA